MRVRLIRSCRKAWNASVTALSERASLEGEFRGDAVCDEAWRPFRQSGSKAYRWVAEMEEIAASLSEDHVPP
jgi:hypothetical protein